MDVPDVLVLITVYLHYTDIIHLSKVCKKFKLILQGKIKKIMSWYTARAIMFTVSLFLKPHDEYGAYFPSLDTYYRALEELPKLACKPGDIIEVTTEINRHFYLILDETSVAGINKRVINAGILILSPRFYSQHPDFKYTPVHSYYPNLQCRV